MKKCVILLVFCVLFCGCTPAETFETVGDDLAQQAMREVKTLSLEVPESALILQCDEGTQYLWEDYTVSLQTMTAGDLSGTLKAVTGMDGDTLTVMKTEAGDWTLCESAWSAAGEGGDAVGRILILDDGAWHYCLSISVPADQAVDLQETWKILLHSLQIQ